MQRKTKEIERGRKTVAVVKMQAEKFAICKFGIFERSALRFCQTQIAIFKFAFGKHYLGQIRIGENAVYKRAVFVFNRLYLLFGKIFALDVIATH